MRLLRPLAGDRFSRCSRISVTALAVVLASLGSDTLGAQTFTSNLRGYVRTAAGAPVADAQVGTRDVETNQRRGTTTNATGYYYIGGLKPGQYEVTVRRIGFEAQSRPIRLAIGQTHDLNFTAGQTTVTLSAVEVRATTVAGVESRTSEIGTNVSREQIENLPSPERNFLDRATTPTPSVPSSATSPSRCVIVASTSPSRRRAPPASRRSSA